jgi:hypothetical protein
VRWSRSQSDIGPRTGPATAPESSHRSPLGARKPHSFCPTWGLSLLGGTAAVFVACSSGPASKRRRDALVSVSWRRARWHRCSRTQSSGRRQQPGESTWRGHPGSPESAFSWSRSEPEEDVSFLPTRARRQRPRRHLLELEQLPRSASSHHVLARLEHDDTDQAVACRYGCVRRRAGVGLGVQLDS